MSDSGLTSRQNLDAAHAFAASLKQDIDESKVIENGLNDLIHSERDRAQELLNSQLQDERYRNQIAQTRQLLEAITKRLAEITLAKDFGGYEARRIEPPHVKK